MKNRELSAIRLGIIFILGFNSIICFSQEKMKLGLTIQGSIGLITNKKQNIDQIFNTLHVTKYEGKVSQNQNRLWTTGELGIDLYLPSKKWKFSGGLRMFKWHYNRDSIIRHYHSQVSIDTKYGPWNISVYKENYAFSKRALSTILPFMSASYLGALSKNSGISYSVSIGYLGLFERKSERNFAYNESLQVHLENTNPDQIKFKYKRKLNPYAFDCRFSVDYYIGLNEFFQLNAGISYYYAQNGIAMHHGMYGNASLSVRLKKCS